MAGLGCISDASLRAFLLGEVPERVARSISSHLEVCPECEAAARRMDALTDPVIDRLRRAFTPGPRDVAVATTVEGGVVPPARRRPGPSTPRVEDYEILEELGRGGTSVVYRARQSHPARVVALKVLLSGPHADAERRARFVAEADTVARLRHPNIVQIHQVGESDGLPYLALEYVDGGSLAQALVGTPWPPARAAGLIEQLAHAAESAHRAGVVHRDLKPANVMLAADGTPKLTDFGLARLEESDLTGTGAVLGTPSYMAPEQAEGRSHEVGPAADVYALGSILYELLTGRPPFRGATPFETLEQVRSQDPVPPGRLQGRMPRDLDTVCLKCLRKEPVARYQSAEALADDLRRVLRGEPILARRAGAAGIAWRWCRRNPAVATLILALVLVVAGVVLGSTAAAIRFRRLANSEAMAHRTAERMVEAEQVARERADRHAAEARAVVDFLINEMLLAATPDGNRGRTMTVDDVLARTGRAIEGHFADQPLVEAAIRHQIALAYYRLKLGLRAAEHARRARDLRARDLGPEHPLTLDSTLLFAQGLHSSGAFGSALGPAELVYRARLHALGPDHLDTADAMCWVAHCINNDPARLEEARSLFTRAIEVLRRGLPPDDPKLTFAICGLAFTLSMQGRYAESLALNEELLATYRRHWGPEHVEVALTLSRKAEVLEWAGRPEEAARDFEEALRIIGRVQDPGYVDAYMLMDRLIDLRTAQAGRARALGRRAEVERLIVTTILPVCNLRVARAESWFARDARDPDARASLALFLAARGGFRAILGRRADALADADRALALRAEAPIPDGSSVGSRPVVLAAADATEDASGGTIQGVLALFEIAQVHALLATTCRDDPARSARDADRAIEHLRGVVAMGFRRKALILDSPGFSELGSRADFRAILASLPPKVEGAIEGESLEVVRASGTFEIAPQALPARRHLGHWSGDGILIASPGQIGEWVELALPVPADGRYRVAAYLVAAPGQGIVQISLDGEPRGLRFDGFRPGAEPRSAAILETTPPSLNVDLGTIDLRKGTATLRIEVVGKNEAASGFSWGLDCVVLRRSAGPTASGSGLTPSSSG